MKNSALISRVDPATLPQVSSPALGLGEWSETGPRPRGARLGTTLRRYWWVVLVLWLLLALPVTWYALVVMKPPYLAKGAVRISPFMTTYLKDHPDQIPYYKEFVNTQAKIIESSKVLDLAARDVRLTNFAWFAKLPDQVDYLSKNVQVEQSQDNELITVSMSHPDPKAAQSIVNAVMDAYFAVVNQEEQGESDKKLEAVNKLFDKTESNILQAESELKALDPGRLISAGDERKSRYDLLTGSRDTFNKLATEQANLRSLLDSLGKRETLNESNVQQSVNVDQDARIAALAAEKARLLTVDAEAASKGRTPEHPFRVAYRKEMKDIDQKIAARSAEVRQTTLARLQADESVEKQRKTLELQSRLASVTQQMDALKKYIDEQESQLKEFNEQVSPIVDRKEKIAQWKDALKRYQDRIDDLKSQRSAPGRIVRGYDAMLPKTPDGDKRLKIALGSNAAGLAAGLFALVLLARLRNRIEDTDDLPEGLQPLVVGTVSNAGRSTRGLQGKMRRKILSEEMRLVHANLLPPGHKERRVIMVTSPTPGNGKTSIASHLALSLAKSGLEVLLIDGDLRKRDVSQMFSLGFKPGLADLLQAGTPEFAQPVELLPNFKVMGAGGELHRNAAELFQRKHFRECLDQIPGQWDVIIVDTPPTLVVADARLMAQSCDEIICVVRSQVSSQREINETLETLSRVRGQMPKIIVNGVQHAQSYYKYKFAYAHSTPGEKKAGETKSTADRTVGLMDDPMEESEN